VPASVPSRWISRLQAAVARFDLWRPGDRVLLAVSGGADSVAMARLLAMQAEASGLQLGLAHFDHGWREDSGQAADFVAALGGQLGLPFYLGRASQRPGRDREQHARRARYAFLLGLVAGGEADRIATAHTADDQAETVLLRLLRGAGPAGAAGILPQRNGGRIIRPLLWARRDELRNWLRRLGQGWIEDPSNQERTLLRNRVRAELLPGLVEDYNPALVARLADGAEIARAEEAFWAAHVATLAEAVFVPPSSGGGIRLPLAALRPLSLAEQRRLLREAMRRVQGDLRGVDFAPVDELLAWIARPATRLRRRHVARVECRLGATYLDVVPIATP